MNLHSKHQSTLQILFAKHPSIKEALLFGSRALGTHKESSDIDIALKGDITPTLLAHLKEELEDSTLPYFCDILDYERAPQELKEHIDTHALTLYKREEEWQEVRLGDVAIFNPQLQIKKESVAKKVSMDMLQPFQKKIYEYSQEVFNGGSKFQNGDTLMARITPCLENGKTAFVDFLEDDEIAFGSTEFIVIRAIEGVSDKHYLYYLMRTEEIRSIAIQSMTGSSGRERVQLDALLEHKIMLPPLERQKEIAEILSSFDDKIDFLHRQNRTLEALNQVVFTEWFVNQAKDEWQEIELGKYLQCITGYSYKSSDLGRSKNALVNLKNFSRNGDFRLDGLKEFIGTKYKEAQTVKHGDLVVAHTDITQEADIIGNPILIIDMGKYENLIISMDLMKIKSNEKWLSTEFLYYLFKTSLFKQHCLANSNGTTVLHMSRQTIPTYKIKIPSIKKIEEFTIYAREKLEKKYNNLLQISTLEKLRNKILQSI